MAFTPRLAEARIRTALRDTRVVAITGPRQSGKTTLARRAATAGRRYLTLDDRATLAAAKSDPVAFIRELDRAVIDEVQRAPDLLLAIKQSVDNDPRVGRFVLTGSANLASIAPVQESLAGRIETIPLYPFSRSERKRGSGAKFLRRILAGESCAPVESLSAEALVRIVCQGGYPEAIARSSEKRRNAWYRAYLESIALRDLPDIATLNKAPKVPKLLQVLAQHAGQLTNLSEIGRAVQLDHKTAEHYLSVLELLFLVRRVPPWSRNHVSRIVKTPKLHFIDTGVLTALRGESARRLHNDRHRFGAVLESFVFSELLKLSSWSEHPLTIWHYRDKDLREVDFVLEASDGRVVGIEVKAAGSVSRSDFAGLERLASAAGSDFVQGILLYDGAESLAFADNLRALPLPCLWA